MGEPYLSAVTYEHGGLSLHPDGSILVWLDDDHYNGVIVAADVEALLQAPGSGWKRVCKDCGWEDWEHENAPPTRCRRFR